MSSILAGRHWQPGQNFREWREEVIRGGLWRELGTHEVAVTLYPLSGQCSPYATGGCFTIRDLLQGTLMSRRRADTVDFWFSSLVPMSVRALLDRAYLADDSPDDRLPGNAAPTFQISQILGLAPQGEAPPSYLLGLWSVRNFERLLEDEAKRPPTGQYVYFHALIPHDPIVFDENCASQPNQSSAYSYLAQATCALRLVDRLVERLAALGRLHDSFIVVHADHGFWPTLIQEFVQQYPGMFDPAAVEAVQMKLSARPDQSFDNLYAPEFFAPEVAAFRSGALLLVKYPGATEATWSQAPARPVDIAPTILEHFGVSTDAYSGSSLLLLSESVEREAVFYMGPRNLREVFGKWRKLELMDEASWSHLEDYSMARFQREGGTWFLTREYQLQ